jgi:cation transport regulator ChaC
MHKIGILAYGSLIDNPGSEIEQLIKKRIECETPFKVEYARKSSSRNDAPTLIPREKIGRNIKAQIFILKDEITIEEAKSILYRREINKVGENIKYEEVSSPSINKVQIKIEPNFHQIETVLYTLIGKNIEGDITPDKLADLAINSILINSEGRDGIRYLKSAKENGIITEFSEQYEKSILEKTETKSLEEAISKLDKTRNKDK